METQKTAFVGKNFVHAETLQRCSFRSPGLPKKSPRESGVGKMRYGPFCKLTPRNLALCYKVILFQPIRLFFTVISVTSSERPCDYEMRFKTEIKFILNKFSTAKK